MTSVAVAKARDTFSEIINVVAYARERVVLTRRGKKLVAVVPVDDLELLERLEDKMDLEEALIALKKSEKEGVVSWRKIKKDLGL